MDPTGSSRPRWVADLEATLLRIAEGARLVGIGWFALLAGLALAQHGDRITAPRWVVVPLIAAVAWGLVSLVAYRRQAEAAIAPLAITVDVAVAAAALLAPTSSGIPDVLFYGGLPLIAVAVAAIRSPTSSWVVAGVLVAVVLIRTGVTDLGDLVGSVSQIVTYVAGALIFTWAVRVLRSSETARRLAIDAAARAEERADMSRHLHDSVLQTLALVQRSADRPDEVVSLARQQERDLREWLYGTPRPAEAGLPDAVRTAAAEVEETYRVTVDVVSVGDTPLDEAVEALVAASREAMVNAAKHAQAGQVSVYAEVLPDAAIVYVRDRGVGFDPEAVPSDRAGIVDSIQGRLEAVGGTAALRTAPGEGTEWRLEVPR